MSILSEYWHKIQGSLEPLLDIVLLDPLTDTEKQLVRTIDFLRIEQFLELPSRQRMGRRRVDRRSLFRAFIAKTVYNLPTTESLVELLRSGRNLRWLCGFERVQDVPSSATFSRAFAEFSKANLGDRIHKSLVTSHISGQIVMHISHDSTEVQAREKRVKKKPAPKPAAKHGRPRADEPRVLPPPTRLERQYDQYPDEALAELPIECNSSAKRDTKGNLRWWTGWKSHLVWADGGIPLLAITTSASLHDSQAALPMMRKVAAMVRPLYYLADSAMDSDYIRQAAIDLDIVPIIDTRGTRSTKKKLMAPHRAERYKQRSTAERGNSRLKDEFGYRHLRVRGHAKAHMHLMLGVLTLFVDQMYKTFGN